MRAGFGASPLLRTHARVRYPYVLAFRQRFGADGQRRMLEDLKQRAMRGGASDVPVVMQDPTDGSVVTMLTRGSVRSDDQLTVVGSQAVEEPPNWPATGMFPVTGPTEPGLTDDESRAVAMALQIEANPRHLEGFAHTLDPYMPISASLLRQRASLLEPGCKARPSPGAADVEGARSRRTSLKSPLPPDLVNVEIKRAASSLSQGETPASTPLGVLDVASKTLRRTHVLCDGTKVYVIDPAAMLAAAPPTGREGFVSETALQLALAAAKPKVSGVVKFDRARSLYAELEAGNVPPEDRLQLLLARDMLDRARRALERRRWVEWYRKQI